MKSYTSYPNIEALAKGCVSGRISEWPFLRVEARELLEERDRLAKVVNMTDKQRKVVEAVRNTLHQHCKDMPPEQYREVLEEVSADIEGNLDALEEEAGVSPLILRENVGKVGEDETTT